MRILGEGRLQVISTIFSIISSLLSSSAHAGAWVQDKGDTMLINQLTYFTSNHYWDRAGDSHKQPTYNKLEYQPYIEYGLAPTITIGGSAYLQRDWQGGANNTGIADPEIFLRARIWHDDTQRISIQPLLKLPSFFDRNSGTPRGGSRSIDGEFSFLYGRNLKLISPNDYTDLRLGYRARGRGLSGQLKADAVLGLSPMKNWQIIPALRYVKADSLSGRTFVQNGEQDYDLLKAEIGVAYHLDPSQWVQATIFDHVAGKQTGNGQGISIGYAVTY